MDISDEQLAKRALKDLSTRARGGIFIYLLVWLVITISYQLPVLLPVFFYLNTILPKIAGLVSGDKEAYDYLASSIAQFYEPAVLMKMMKTAGFAKVYARKLTFGVVTIYVGIK